MTVKFLWNGLKVDGALYRGRYYAGEYTEYSKLPKGTITIHRRDYGYTPSIEGMEIRNESDIMTDYFEKDKVIIKPDSHFYNDALAAYNKQEEHNKKRFAKKYA